MDETRNEMMMNWRKSILIILLVWGVLNLSFSQKKSESFNSDSLISLMSQSEKIDFISGYQNFNIKGNERLGIPQIKMADGPMGVKGHGKATAYPASICMAATWNSGLIVELGEAIAKEAKSKGIGILLAPGVNNYRIPQCGRNFEYYGEDPFLSSQMTVSFINGVQSQKVMATAKHFVANNHDYDRHRVSSNIDERSLHEIYFPPFKAAIEQTKVGAIMTSYNLLNGVHTSESKYLMEEILRDTWGFKGIIMSDWISVYSLNAFDAGLDLEMPRSQFMNHHNVDSLIKRHPEYISLLDRKVSHIISTCQRIGLYDSLWGEIDSIDWDKHQLISRQVAREGIVLLKNENQILPLLDNDESKVLVLGPNAKYTPYSGGGAAQINAERNVSFWQGIKEMAPDNFHFDYLDTEALYHLHSEINRVQFVEDLQQAKAYDKVILCLGFNSKTEGEAFDRPFSLPREQEFLMEKLSEINENIIVLVNAGGGISMPWLPKAKALLYAWYAGEDGGNAIGEIIFGKVNPSGKLPISIERRWKDNAAYSSYDSSHAVVGAKPFYTLYGKAHDAIPMEYSEGIFTGYRHFDRMENKPLFAFGFGLSFTSFEYSNFECANIDFKRNDCIQIQLEVTNTGGFDGSETIQLYIRDLESSLPRPEKELKAFQKLYLEKEESKIVEFRISKEDLMFYHPQFHDWIVEEGEFEIKIGSASDHIIFSKKIQYHK